MDFKQYNYGQSHSEQDIDYVQNRKPNRNFNNNYQRHDEIGSAGIRQNNNQDRDWFRNPTKFGNNGSNNQDSPQKQKHDSLPFQKVFIDPKYTNYTEEIVKEFREEYDIMIRQGKNVAHPFISWEDCKYPSTIMQRIEKKGFSQPTAIQAQVFPVILSGCDLIGIAQTGSGKTVAFLLPGIIHLNAQPKLRKGDGPIILILAPTRELAMQIHEQVQYFGAASNLTSACIYGGAEKKGQEFYLSRGCDIVVATPGRLIDFLECGVTNLNRVTYLVIDEADRMLDMGFEPQVRRIVDDIRPDRQTVFFSATWPKEIQQLAKDLCHHDVVHIQIGTNEMTVNKNIEQRIYCVRREDKYNELMNALDELTMNDKVLIFAETKRGCEQLSKDLTTDGYFALSLHGDKTQSQRDYVMKQFKTSEARLVCATDVASRGLDVRDITIVINYDIPKQIDNYIHRIGRTGRAGDKGVSVSFLTYEDDDPRIAKTLIDILKKAEQNVPEELYDFAKSSYQGPPRQGNRPNFNNFKRNFDNNNRGNPNANYGNQNSNNNYGNTNNNYKNKFPADNNNNNYQRPQQNFQRQPQYEQQSRQQEPTTGFFNSRRQ